jgi:hypothetical protein
MQTSEQKLNTFERKILRIIHGPIQEGGRWRHRSDNKLYILRVYKEAISRRTSKLDWDGRITIRIEEERIPTKVLNGKFHTIRPVGRPRTRWADVVQRDALKLPGIRGWRRRAKNRDEWRRLMREAKAIHHKWMERCDHLWGSVVQRIDTLSCYIMFSTSAHKYCSLYIRINYSFF